MKLKVVYFEFEMMFVYLEARSFVHTLRVTAYPSLSASFTQVRRPHINFYRSNQTLNSIYCRLYDTQTVWFIVHRSKYPTHPLFLQRQWFCLSADRQESQNKSTSHQMREDHRDAASDIDACLDVSTTSLHLLPEVSSSTLTQCNLGSGFYSRYDITPVTPRHPPPSRALPLGGCVIGYC